ncbi:CotH kinase family protein [Neobacillus dielmonensis]|uniref:CotH kinase family protein n=1 Tax=Neobacillus dielmonensis TaxID=1347369 RepID=UPI0005A7D278|nr:CotH kinase family protein [Neobacillus dielmonensis]
MKLLKRIEIPLFVAGSILILIIACLYVWNSQHSPKEIPVEPVEKRPEVIDKTTASKDFEESNFPVFSIKTNPDNLWSKEKGIYILGDHASTQYPYKGANYWQEKRIPVEIEIKEPGKDLFKASAELEIFGGETRTLPQKSFALFAKKEDGKKSFDYPLFPEKELHDYESFVLRNGGQDFARTHMVDGLVSTLVKDTEIDFQAYRPVVVYLNEEYWGIYDLREKINDAFLADNHGVKKKDIDLLEADAVEKEGSNKDYLQLIDYIKNHDLKDQDHFNYVKNQIDIENFMDYVITELYIANNDWPSHNIRYWKAEDEYDRWRWIIYDSDLSFENYQENTVERLYNYKGKGDDSLYISFLFRELIKNEQFRKELSDRADYHLTQTFQPERVIGTINKIRQQLEPEMPNHLEKWEGNLDDWRANVQELQNFAQKRPQYLKKYLTELFDTLQ